MLNRAIQEAAIAHGAQKRKGTDIPYITHPFMVAMILSEAGYTEDEVVAGVPHDTLEDTELTADDIENLFGKHVREIVVGCTKQVALQRQLGGTEATYYRLPENCLFRDKGRLLRGQTPQRQVYDDRLRRDRRASVEPV